MALKLNLDADITVENMPPNDTVSQLDFSPKSNLLSASSWDGIVRVYSVFSPEVDFNKKELNNANAALQASYITGYTHSQPVLTTGWLQDKYQIISGGCDKLVKIFDIGTGHVADIGHHEAPVSSVKSVMIGGSPIIVSSSWDKTLSYWDLRQQQAVCSIQLDGKALSMDSRDGVIVLVTSDRTTVKIDLSNPTVVSGTFKSRWELQPRVVKCLPGGECCIIGGTEGRCVVQYFRDVKSSFSFKCHRTTTGTDVHIYSVNDIAVNPIYGSTLTAGSDGSLQIWDHIKQCRLSYSGILPGSVSSCAYNNNGSILAYAVYYDWSKGYQFSRPNYPKLLKLHKIKPETVELWSNKNKIKIKIVYK
ncbi:RNA export factor GLE2 [Sugiyamaella lignohabitans]|uniref:RNA export factor GLE2 n=1 Tax=Sugiyamaella lignohabitans TaxID=796027 RepID=A0A167EYA2_9ASCO|nr:RNA export factor GLE2 [Sugiyamaella lignohabitans]ANB14603.1 RNA export factor GLE2 [Sugiyamaella lignohabitans]